MPKTREFLHKLSGLNRVPKIDHVVQVILAFTIGSIFSIYFRSPSIGVAHDLLGDLLSGWGTDIHDIITNTGAGREHVLYLGYNIFEFSITMFFLLVLESTQLLQEKRGSIRAIISKQNVIVRWSLYIILSVLIILFSFERQIPFIYFQF